MLIKGARNHFSPASYCFGNTAHDDIVTRTHSTLQLDSLVFSAKHLPCQSAPSLCWCSGLFWSRCRKVHWHLLNFPSTCQLTSPACPGPSEKQPCPPGYWLLVHKLTESALYHHVPLIKTLNSTGSNIHPWDTPLVTGWQLFQVMDH